MKAAVLALTIPLQPLVSENVLEPSVRNEVDHALSRAARTERAGAASAAGPYVSDAVSTNAFVDIHLSSKSDVFNTNGLSSTDIAIKIVSLQRPDGTWKSGTNDVTSVAVEILKSL
jgi:hypothetical protein